MDIVERLLKNEGPLGHYAIRCAAADEIKKLRAALIIARAWIPLHHEKPHLQSSIDLKIVDAALSNTTTK
jgi:hypothetical protein